MKNIIFSCKTENPSDRTIEVHEPNINYKPTKKSDQNETIRVSNFNEKWVDLLIDEVEDIVTKVIKKKSDIYNLYKLIGIWNQGKWIRI